MYFAKCDVYLCRNYANNYTIKYDCVWNNCTVFFLTF